VDDLKIVDFSRARHRLFHLLLGILSLLLLTSCGCKQARDDLLQGQFFAEILKREDLRWIGEDSFFENALLGNSYPEVHRWSAVALGRIASPRALPLLYRALHTGDAPVRAASAFAIGAIEDRRILEERCIQTDPAATAELSRLLLDPSLSVQMRAVEALGKIGSHAEALEIVRGLERFPYGGAPADRAFLDFAITALERLKDPVAAPVLERLADASDPEIQWRALDALIRLESRNSCPLFIRNLGNPNPAVRAIAAQGLGFAGDPSQAGRLLPLLCRHREQALSVRLSVLQALGELKNPAAIPAIRAAIAAEPIDSAHPDQQNLAIQAASTLGLIGTAQADAALVTLLEIPGPVADHAVIALAKILRGNPERFFGLVDSSRFANPSALPAWIQAMAELGGPDAAEELNRILLQAAGSPAASETEAEILTALARTETPGVQEILAPFLSSHDIALLRAAVTSYKPGARAKAPWAPIAQAFTLSSSSGDVAARLEILSHLSPWIRAPKVQQMLQSGLKDPERQVRLACAALLRRAGVAGVAADPGPSTGILTEAFRWALAASRNNSTVARLETTRGPIEVELFREDAPVTVAYFVLMARGGAYDGLKLEQALPLRRVEGKGLQTLAGFGRPIKSEIGMRPFERGSVGMAESGGYSEPGRFFIALGPQPYLDGIDRCFGRVLSGMQVAERIAPGDRIERVLIKEYPRLLDRHQY
jgi:peptidyl-prolyl cis-trans isomerase B (cyclophilin B)